MSTKLRGAQRSPELALGSTDFHVPENLIFPVLQMANSNPGICWIILLPNEFCKDAIFLIFFNAFNGKLLMRQGMVYFGMRAGFKDVFVTQ